MHFIKRLNFLSAIVVLFDRLSYLHALTWEVSKHTNENDSVWKSFNVESDNIRIDKEEIYLTHRVSTAACLRGPPSTGLNTNSDVILVTEFCGSCDLITKIMTAKDAGFFGIIFIRDKCTPNKEEVKIRGLMTIDFRVLFTNADTGVKIRDFGMKDSSQNIRHKVRLRPVVENLSQFFWNWSCMPQRISYIFFSQIEDCRQFMNRNALPILGYGILLIATIFTGYYSMWYIVCWFFLPLFFVLTLFRRSNNPLVRVRHFLGLREIIWQRNNAAHPSHCSICLDEFQPGQVLLKIRGCGHLDFHKLCLHQWLQRTFTPSCPLCRRRIRESHRGPVEFQRVASLQPYSPTARSNLTRLIDCILDLMENLRDSLVNWIVVLIDRALDDIHNGMGHAHIY